MMDSGSVEVPLARDEDGADAPGLGAALSRLAAGEDAAWAEVIAAVGDEMVALARRLTGDPELARDAAQEALIRVRDSASTFQRDFGDGGDAAARR